jgi:hypothetical protein
VRDWVEVFSLFGEVVLSRADLLAAGVRPRELTTGVRSGVLLRLRRDHYSLPGLARPAQEAVRVGGKLGCVSALRDYGVFAYDARHTHVQVDPFASRLRSPHPEWARLTEFNRGGIELHWLPELAEQESEAHRVSLIDALLESLYCQHPWHTLASIDNALHQRLITRDDLDAVFHYAPSRLGVLEPLIDERAESGQETVLRMIVRETGLPYELQVSFPDAGRVDILVAGCLVLEADSRAFHDGWEAHVRDRGRDLVFASMGLASLRPAYQHTMHRPTLVKRAIEGLVGQQLRHALR